MNRRQREHMSPVLKKHTALILRRLLSGLTVCVLICALCACIGPTTAEELETPVPTESSIPAGTGIPADAEGRLGWIRDKGVLRVATEPYYSPQEFIDNSKHGQERYVGADMELARLIAERMGVRLEIVPMSFSRVLLSVVEGECDLAISALAYTPGRAEQAELSKGYHFSGEEIGTGILIRTADRETIRTLDDLKGLRIAAQRGSIQEAFLAEHVYNYGSFRRVPTLRDVYSLLRSGQADAAAVDSETAENYLSENAGVSLMLVPDLRFTVDPAFDGDRIAARKGETELIDYVNTILDEVVESGRYEQWFDYYTLYASWLKS